MFELRFIVGPTFLFIRFSFGTKLIISFQGATCIKSMTLIFSFLFFDDIIGDIADVKNKIMIIQMFVRRL